MARISVWYVRAALFHFALGATTGAWGLATKSGIWPPFPSPTRPLHVEAVLIGWVCQLAVGVALWIFPFSGSVSEDVRFWGAWGFLNAGVLLVVLGKWNVLPELQVVGRASELLAAGLLAWGLWPRLRPLPQRDAHGEI